MKCQTSERKAVQRRDEQNHAGEHAESPEQSPQEILASSATTRQPVITQVSLFHSRHDQAAHQYAERGWNLCQIFEAGGKEALISEASGGGYAQDSNGKKPETPREK
jgi:hypothetical protein